MQRKNNLFFLMVFATIFMTSCSKSNDDIAPNDNNTRYIKRIIKVQIRGRLKRDTCHIILKRFHETFDKAIDSIHYNDLYSGINLKDSIHFSIEKQKYLKFKYPVPIPKFDIPFKSGGDGMEAFNSSVKTKLSSYDMGASIPSITTQYREGFTATGNIYNYTLTVGYIKKDFSADIGLIIEDNFGAKDTLLGHVQGINRGEPLVGYSYNE